MFLKGLRRAAEGTSATGYVAIEDAPVVTLGGSDWKYGWPHKFYVGGIPNPRANCSCPQYGYGGSLDSWKKEYPDVKQVEGADRKFWLHDYPAPASVSAKWYNEHLKDITDEATFRMFTELLADRSGIIFGRDDEGLKYSAPHRGYQAPGGM